MFLPQLRLISDMTVALEAEVTTTEEHGYDDGQLIRVIVPEAYGMSLNEASPIAVTSTTTFTTAIDTSTLLPFVAPSFVAYGPAFTQAQAIPITGVTENIL